MSINKVILVGNVGKDPEVRTFDSGNKVANFPLATSEKYTNKSGEKVENTEWHNIAVFGKLADIVEKYVVKGQQLYIEGKIKTRSWEKDGEKKYMTEIVLMGFNDSLQMLGTKSSSPEQQTQTPQAPSSLDAPPQGEEDLPF